MALSLASRSSVNWDLRLRSTKLERILAALLHDPTTKGLIRRVALGDVAVAIDTLKPIQGERVK
jgi:hypothetical protein